MCAGGGVDVDILQDRGGCAEISGSTSEDDVILIELREHRRNLPLAEGIVEGVVEWLRGDAEARGGVAVDDEHGVQAQVLLVGGDVAQLGNLLHLLDQSAEPIRPVQSGSGSSR